MILLFSKGLQVVGNSGNHLETSHRWPNRIPPETTGNDFGRRMATKRLLVSVFAPEGWPTSVAPEYGRYQLWDTIQQVRFFLMTTMKGNKKLMVLWQWREFLLIFGQDCDLESKSADAWMICLFSCIRNASINGTNNTLCFFWRRWPSSWTLLLSFDIIDMMIMVIFDPTTSQWTKYPKNQLPLAPILRSLASRRRSSWKGAVLLRVYQRLSVENLYYS